MKKLLPFAAAAALLVSCNNAETFSIEGSFNIPESFQLGDTVIERGPIEGSVYLIGLDNEPIDSVEITDDKFQFTGVVDKKKPYIAYLACDYAIGMLVIEPGEIKVEMSEQVVATGTPTNDGITQMNDGAEEISNRLYDELYALRQDGNDAMSDSLLMPLYLQYSQLLSSYIDSIYTANKDNLLGVYAANLQTSQIQSAEELESVLSEYSEYVRNSELMQARIQYYKSVYEDEGNPNETDLSDLTEDLLEGSKE